MAQTTLLPAGFLEGLNAEHQTVDRDEIAAESPSMQAQSEPNPPVDDPEVATPARPDDGSPDWLKDLEGGSAEDLGMDGEEIHLLSQAAVDFVKMGKDGINAYFKSKFGKVIKANFAPSQHKMLSVVILADTEKKLSVDGLGHMLDLLSKRTDKYKGIDFAELVEIYTGYKALKERYEATELKDYQAQGIQKYTEATLHKYLGEARPDPAIMLMVYLIIIFGADLMKLWFAQQDLKKEEHRRRHELAA